MKKLGPERTVYNKESHWYSLWVVQLKVWEHSRSHALQQEQI